MVGICIDLGPSTGLQMPPDCGLRFAIFISLLFTPSRRCIADMDIFFSYLLYLLLFSISLPIVFLIICRRKSSDAGLPPGRMGWPVIGETLDFALACQGGNPERFVNDRMSKYSPSVFKTSLLEADMAVMCGASGNKFVFSNEGKFVVSWWNRSMKKLLCFPSVFEETLRRDKFRPPTFLPEFLRAESLQNYIPIMDSMAIEHIELDWSRTREVKAFPLAKKYSFALAFRLFMSIADPVYVDMISHPFELLTEGFLAVPLDIPGTTFNRALKASKFIHNELLAIIRKRKMEMEMKGESGTRDLLSHMLLASDENGNVKSEMEISTQVICLLLATHHTTSSVITFILKYLAEIPDVYHKVLEGKYLLLIAFYS